MRFLTAITALVAAVTALPTENTVEVRDIEERQANKTLSYSQRAVIQHNLHRANNSAPNVTWDNNLTLSAKALALKCVFKHNTTIGPAKTYGQNLAVGYRSNNITGTITDLWYNEISLYPGPYGGEPSMSRFGDWGHYSQVVWAGTTKIGCWTTTTECKSVAGAQGIPPYLTVCNYGPPGNYGGQYGKNVLKPLGRKPIKWNTAL